MGFSSDFVWGAATAAYQIEGAANEDGRGLSVWDICCLQEGFVKDGDTGNVACDHYHRMKSDVALMKELGLKAYRFSISWPRVIPNGFGEVNEKGLDFYSALVDELLANKIEPYVTLFHWDYPVELFKMGGWLNPASSDWFAMYTKVVVDKLSDRVKHWITLNEPQCFIRLGHENGTHAPGLKLQKYYSLQAAHNTLLAHGKAVQVIRQYSKQPCEIGYAPIGDTRIPLSASERDIEAARKATFACNPAAPLWAGTWWLDTALFGRYPKEAFEGVLGSNMPKIGQNDMKTICQPLDFLGLNMYQGEYVKAADNEEGYEFIKRSVGYSQTAMKWPVTPEMLYYGPKFYYERYKLPILITENGLSSMDWVNLDGKVHDPNRIDFLKRYLLQYRRAAEEGVALKGYMQWSLMDNFEWGEGYNERFGLIYVDYPSQKRIIKDSGYWYRSVIEANGENL